eukprot:750671-Hanusia_phi.AAC.3
MLESILLPRFCGGGQEGEGRNSSLLTFVPCLAHFPLSFHRLLLPPHRPHPPADLKALMQRSRFFLTQAAVHRAVLVLAAVPLDVVDHIVDLLLEAFAACQARENPRNLLPLPHRR